MVCQMKKKWLIYIQLAGTNSGHNFTKMIFSFMNSIDSISAENNEFEVHVVGDFNIDLLNKSSSDTKRLVCLMQNQGLKQVQMNPTRITENPSTLIDHHYSTHPEHILDISSSASVIIIPPT